MKQYCLGFMFDNEGNNVVLIEKLRPEWQKGKLNGVGGKVEKTENYRDAMVREFKEETGVSTSEFDWMYVGTCKSEYFNMGVFTCFNTEYYHAAKTVEKERILRRTVRLLPYGPYGKESLIHNILSLIELCLDPEMKSFTLEYK